VVRPEPHQPLDETDVGADRRLIARRRFVLENLLGQGVCGGCGDCGDCWLPASEGAAHGSLLCGFLQSNKLAPLLASASFLARCASLDFACSSARKSETTRAAAALDGSLVAT
jgi:hypothetical protein